jgi:hypothetical protein
MLCDTDVHLTNGIPAGPGPVPRWKQYQRIYGREASFDNPESKLGVTGIGTVWLLQAGNQLPAPGQPAAPVKPAAGTAGGETMKLTRVTFEGSMVGFKANNKVIFTGGVDLIHLPADDPDVAIDPGRLPPGGMRVNCERLEAAQIPVPGQKDVTQQAFDATGRVWVGGDGQTFWGQCDHLTYEESKDLLILEGQGGNFAKLARQVRRGAKPETVEAKKIKFWRNENRIEFENARNIGVAPPPGKPQ